jgi:hypothetical protein
MGFGLDSIDAHIDYMTAVTSTSRSHLSRSGQVFESR